MGSVKCAYLLCTKWALSSPAVMPRLFPAANAALARFWTTLGTRDVGAARMRADKVDNEEEEAFYASAVHYPLY